MPFKMQNYCLEQVDCAEQIQGSVWHASLLVWYLLCLLKRLSWFLSEGGKVSLDKYKLLVRVKVWLLLDDMYK